jgi:hypothetical protein
MDQGELGASAVNQPVTVEAAISHLPPTAARMAAIEILLADLPPSMTTRSNPGCISCARNCVRQRGREFGAPTCELALFRAGLPVTVNRTWRL